MVDTKMGNQTVFHRMEELITTDKNLLATLVSYVSVFLIFINLTFFRSPILGIPSTLTYFLINLVFVEQAFFQKEKPFLRLMLGTLLLIAFLGLVSWAIMIIYNLDAIRSTIALFIVATVSSIMHKFEIKRLRR